MAPEMTLAHSGDSEKDHSFTQISSPTFRLVVGRKKCAPGSIVYPLRHALQLFSDASNEGWGAHSFHHPELFAHI